MSRACFAAASTSSTRGLARTPSNTVDLTPRAASSPCTRPR